MSWREGLHRALYGIAASRPGPGVITQHEAARIARHTELFQTLEVQALEALIEGYREGASELRVEILEALDEWRKEGGT